MKERKKDTTGLHINLKLFNDHPPPSFHTLTDDKIMQALWIDSRTLHGSGNLNQTPQQHNLLAQNLTVKLFGLNPTYFHPKCKKINLYLNAIMECFSAIIALISFIYI